MSVIYCLRCKQYTEYKNPNISQTNNERTMISAYSYGCNNMKNRFLKDRNSKGLLSSLALKTPLSKVPILKVIFAFD